MNEYQVNFMYTIMKGLISTEKENKRKQNFDHIPEFLKCISEILRHKIKRLKTIKRICGILCNIRVKWLDLCLPCQEMLSNKREKNCITQFFKHLESG